MSVDIYALIHDPTVLLSLLFSKYGDIEEDLNYLYINQIFFNKKSHYSTLFKEFRNISLFSEFLKRCYSLEESLERLPHLSEYYRTYHLFFCRPFFRQWSSTKLLNKYGNIQAEIFYKNNLASSDSKIHKLTSGIEHDDINSLSSLDNQTQVEIIFNRRIQKIIENKDNITLSLNTEHTLFKGNRNNKNHNHNDLITHESKTNSFVEFVKDFITGKYKQPNPICRGTCNNMKISSGRLGVKNSQNKRSLCYLTKVQNDHTENNRNSNKILCSPKMNPYVPNFKSNIVEFNQNKLKPNNIYTIKNKTSFYNSTSNTNANNHPQQSKLNKLNYTNTNTTNNKNSIMIMTIPSNNNGGNSTTNLNINFNFNLNNNTNCSSRLVQFNPNHMPDSKYSSSKKNTANFNKAKSIKNKNNKHKPTITDLSSLNNLNPLLQPSSSIPHYFSPTKRTKTKSSQRKNKYSYPNRVHNTNNNNLINTEHFPNSNILMNLQFQTHTKLRAICSQRNINGNRGNNNNYIRTPTMSNRKTNFSPKTSHNLTNNYHSTNSHSSNKIETNSNRELFVISRNQKNLQKTSVQTVRSNQIKKLHKSNELNNIKNNKNKSNTTLTKSVDNKAKMKNKTKRNMLSELTNVICCGNHLNNHLNQTKQPNFNQLDNYVKCAKYSKCVKINNNKNFTSHYNKTTKHKHTKSNLKHSHLLEVSSGTSRGNSNKQTQSHVNSNFKLKSSERKTIRLLSPKY